MINRLFCMEQLLINYSVYFTARIDQIENVSEDITNQWLSHNY